MTITVSAPFDDPSASLTAGTLTSPTVIFGPGDVDLDRNGAYANDAPFETPIADLLVIFLSPGASTQGAFSVLVNIVPP